MFSNIDITFIFLKFLSSVFTKPNLENTKLILSSTSASLLWNFINLSRHSFVTELAEVGWVLFHAFKNLTVKQDSTIRCNTEVYLLTVISNISRGLKNDSSLLYNDVSESFSFNCRYN